MTHWSVEQVAQAFLDAGLPQHCADIVRQEGVTGRLLHETIQTDALGDMGVTNKFHQAKIRVLWEAQGESTPMTPRMTPLQAVQVQPTLNAEVHSPMTPPARPHLAPVPTTPPKHRAMLPFHSNGTKLGHGSSQKQKQQKMKRRRRVNFDGRDAITNTYLFPQTSIVAAGGEALASANQEATILACVAKKLWANHVRVDLGRLRNPQQSALNDSWVSTGRCMMHSACRLGGGARYRFTGAFTSMGYSVAVSKVGVCTGGLVVLRKRKNCKRPPTTRAARILVLQTYADLQVKHQGKPVLPSDVARELGHSVMSTLSPSSLRQILRTKGFATRCLGKRKRCGAQLWSTDLEPFFATRSDPDNATVCCISRSLGTFVTSFVVIAPPFFRETARIFREGACTALVGVADT